MKYQWTQGLWTTPIPGWAPSWAQELSREPLRANQAPAAAVLTIPSPTSSPWGVLPSPWPHLWSSPATPCITAVKTKTLQRPLWPPHPCMTRHPQPLPVEPLNPDWPTNRSQNQYTKTSAVPALPPLVRHPHFTVFSPSLYERLNTLVSVQTLVLLTAETTTSSFTPPWIHWDCNTFTAEMHSRCLSPFLGSHPLPSPPTPFLSQFFFFSNVS